MDTQAEWEKAVDNTLLPAIDDVLNVLHQGSKVNGVADVNYIKVCASIINKKASAYISNKTDALIRYVSDAETIL